jgi:hypothetical protein
MDHNKLQPKSIQVICIIHVYFPCKSFVGIFFLNFSQFITHTLIYESVDHFPCRDMLLLIVSLSDRLAGHVCSHLHTLTRPQSFVSFK